MGLPKEDPPASYNRQPSFHEEDVHVMSMSTSGPPAMQSSSALLPASSGPRGNSNRHPPGGDPPLADDMEMSKKAAFETDKKDSAARKPSSSSSSAASRWCDPSVGILDQPWCDPDGVLGRFVLSIGTGPSTSALPSSSSMSKKREGNKGKSITDLLSPVSNDATEASSIDEGTEDYYTYSASYSEWSPSFEDYDGDESSKLPPNKQRRGRFLVWPASGGGR